MRAMGEQRWWLLPGVLAALTLWACGGDQDPVGQQPNYRDLPADQVVLGMQTDIKDMGSRRALLHADTAYMWEDSAKSVMFPVDLKLHDKDGTLIAHLTADEGELDLQTNNMFATGSVVLVTADSARRILTEELHYDPTRGLIWSDVHTVLIQDETRFEGAGGFRANSDMTDIEVFESRGENIEIEF